MSLFSQQEAQHISSPLRHMAVKLDSVHTHNTTSSISYHVSIDLREYWLPRDVPIVPLTFRNSLCRITLHTPIHDFRHIRVPHFCCHWLRYDNRAQWQHLAVLNLPRVLARDNATIRLPNWMAVIWKWPPFLAKTEATYWIIFQCVIWRRDAK